MTLVARNAEDAARRMLPARITVHELGSRFKWLYFPECAPSMARGLGLADLTTIYATGVVAGWLGSILSTYLRSHPALVCGAYTPREYCYPKSRRFADYGSRLRCEHFDRWIADPSKLFMSEVVRHYHAESFGRSLEAAPICVLPIDAGMFKRIERRPDRFKVVSVGRLCSWKTYNLYMIPIVKQLRGKGYPVHWHVYGVGELEAEMRREIRESRLENCIHMHGNLEYGHFPEALADAGAFVGMGTALVEAGFGRVPGVVALEHAETAKTYGRLYDLPLGACGERLDYPPECDTADILEKTFRMSDSEYRAEMDRIWEYVQPFNQVRVFGQLLRCFENSRPCRGSYWKFAAYNLHGLYRKAFRTLPGLLSK